MICIFRVNISHQIFGINCKRIFINVWEIHLYLARFSLHLQRNHCFRKMPLHWVYFGQCSQNLIAFIQFNQLLNDRLRGFRDWRYFGGFAKFKFSKCLNCFFGFWNIWIGSIDKSLQTQDVLFFYQDLALSNANHTGYDNLHRLKKYSLQNYKYIIWQISPV